MNKDVIMQKSRGHKFNDDFRIIQAGNELFYIESISANLMAIISEDNKIEYNISGVYNSGSDFEEINMDELMKLKTFCEDMLK